MLPQLPNLKVLELMAARKSDWHKNQVCKAPFQAAENASADTLRTMFAEMLTATNGSILKQLSLEVLNIQGLNLNSSAAMLASAIDIRKLKSLTMQNCVGVAGVLDTLRMTGGDGQNDTICLRSLVMIITMELEPDPVPQLDASLDSLLKSFSGLERLIVLACTPDIPPATLPSLEGHTQSLKCLGIDRSPESHSLQSVRGLFQQCRMLEQVGLRLVLHEVSLNMANLMEYMVRTAFCTTSFAY